MAELVDAHVSGACAARRAGSSPVLGTDRVITPSSAAIAQLVEHDLAKVGVASSSLVCRSLLFDIQNQLRSIHTEEAMPRWRNW